MDCCRSPCPEHVVFFCTQCHIDFGSLCEGMAGCLSERVKIKVKSELALSETEDIRWREGASLLKTA